MAATPKEVTVLIVDDRSGRASRLTAAAREAPGVCLAGVASTALDASELVRSRQPDCVIVALDTIDLDSRSILHWMSRDRTAAVTVICSSPSDSRLGRAAELGAVDFSVISEEMAESSSDDPCVIAIRKAAAAARLTVEQREAAAHELLARLRPGLAPEPVVDIADPLIVLIGASTGGTRAIQAILRKLPPTFPAAVVAALHMPGKFTASFAERLDREIALRVEEIKEGNRPGARAVSVAPGGCHTLFARGGDGVLRFRLEPSAAAEVYVPAIDRLFLSALDCRVAVSVTAVLTGMGTDGARGAAALCLQGVPVLVEHQSTALVSSMPEAVIATGASVATLPVDEMGAAICRIVLAHKATRKHEPNA
ncbi:MAG: hypothetical protein HYV63_27005 [Candidatus Schekmanbacteria bacterium]|nr:hypothetical protein [Candidatus Schekmanbacteria bacterium]